MSPQPPVAIVTDGTLLNVPQDPPPPYPSRERRHRRRRTAVEASSADSDDLAYLDITHAPPHPHLDETAPLLGVSSPTRRARTMSLSSAASISPSLAQTVVSAFRMDLDSDGEDGEETTHDRSAVGTLPDDHLPHAPGLIRHRARGWRARWRHYFRPVGRRGVLVCALSPAGYQFSVCPSRVGLSLCVYLGKCLHVIMGHTCNNAVP